MISTAHRFILLHVPKTGGNAIQSVLVDHSDDRIAARGNQDGVDRFNIRGPVTPTKHATLADYVDALGDDVWRYRIAITCREPLSRAIAYYFSPHFWHRQRTDGTYEPVRPVWQPDLAMRRVARMAPAVDFLRVGGRIHTPDFVIRHESLEDDLAKFASSVGLPRLTAPHRNVTFAERSERVKAATDPDLAALARRRFAEDFTFFDYPDA